MLFGDGFHFIDNVIIKDGTFNGFLAKEDRSQNRDKAHRNVTGFRPGCGCNVGLWEGFRRTDLKWDVFQIFDEDDRAGVASINVGEAGITLPLGLLLPTIARVLPFSSMTGIGLYIVWMSPE
jgi:hypothetical protein